MWWFRERPRRSLRRSETALKDPRRAAVSTSDGMSQHAKAGGSATQPMTTRLGEGSADEPIGTPHDGNVRGAPETILQSTHTRHCAGTMAMQVTSEWWALWMLLFVAVNAHAAVASYRALQRERREATRRRQRCSLKRRHPETSGDRTSVAVVDYSLPVISHGRHGKRRRVGCCRPRFVGAIRREHVVWPWPTHVSFHSLDIVRDSEQLIASWLAHPTVAAGTTKLRDLVREAVQEVLVSCLSFALCAIAVLLLRRYSNLVVGVSVDLGAFSLDI